MKQFLEDHGFMQVPYVRRVMLPALALGLVAIAAAWLLAILSVLGSPTKGDMVIVTLFKAGGVDDHIDFRARCTCAPIRQ